MNLVFQGTRTPLPSFTLDLEATFSGRVHVVFGPSGSGKTTLVELVAGLRRPETGQVRLGEQVLFDAGSRVWVPPARRCVGYVPQDLALFPHRTVRGNLEYARHAGRDGAIPFEGVVAALEIGDLLDRPVHLLSGGEKQRVALGRALLSQPRVLLLDEPLSNLDGPLRLRLQRYIARVRDEFQVPMVLVTHDRAEALALGDEVTVLHHGRVLQQGPAAEVFGRPSTLAVASIVGTETVAPAVVGERRDGLVSVRLGGVSIWAPDPGGLAAGGEVFVCIRAEEVLVLGSPPGLSSARNVLPAVVVARHAEQGLWRVELDAGFHLNALVSRAAADELDLQPGRRVHAVLKAPAVHLVAR